MTRQNQANTAEAVSHRFGRRKDLSKEFIEMLDYVGYGD
jgi:hypothetical protein